MTTLTPTTPSPAKKGNGKGLVWNNNELLALAHAAPKVCLDPAVGKGMSRRVLGDKLRLELIESSLRPTDACSVENSKDHRDKRRWNGRSSEACYRKWIIMRKDCSKLFAIENRIKALHLTGNFCTEDFMRMAKVEFSCGKQVNGHLYDIGNNKDYSFIDKFEFSFVYHFLVGNTSLVSGAAFQNIEGDGEESGKRQNERPIGVKEAKKRKEQSKKMEGKPVLLTVQQSAHDMSMSMRKTQEAIERKNEGKMELESKKLDFEQEKYWMSRAESVANDSDASEEERALAKKLIRKRTLTSLADIFQKKSKETEKAFVENGWIDPRTNSTPTVHEKEIATQEECESQELMEEEVDEHMYDATDDTLASTFQCHPDEIEE